MSLATRDIRIANGLASMIDAQVIRAFTEAEARAHKPAQTSAASAAVVSRMMISAEQAFAAIKAWETRQLAHARIRAFNSVPVSDDQLRRLATVLTRYVADDDPEGWRVIPDFDVWLVNALMSVGLKITTDHRGLRHLRVPFATAWAMTLWREEEWRIGTFTPPASTSPFAESSTPPPASAAAVPPSAARTNKLATELAPTVFLAHEVACIAQTGQESRQAAMYLSDLRQFAAAHPGLTIKGVIKVVV